MIFPFNLPDFVEFGCTMASCNRKSTPKRALENNDNDSQLKRQRPNSPTAEKQTKIIDLDDDCLESIFDHLNLAGLFNVAVANEWLRPAARIVYKRRFAKKLVKLNADRVVPSLLGPIERTKYVHVNGLEMCLQYLRCFGSSIRDLRIWYGKWDAEQRAYIDQYVNEYCAEHLVQVAFLGAFIQRIEKPFANAQTVIVCSCDLSNRLASFPHWFPNVHALILNKMEMDACVVEMPFNELTYLDIDINNGNVRSGLTNEEFARLLKLCPKLRSLEIHVPHSQPLCINALLDTIQDNRPIWFLTVSMDRLTQTVKLSEIQRLVNEHPSLSKLDLQNYKFTAAKAIALIRQLRSLSKCRLQLKSPLEYQQLVLQLNGQWQSSSHTDFYGRFIVMLNR